MTKGKLLRLLEGVPDAAVVLRPGEDHSYNKASVIVTTALYNSDGQFYQEDHGDDHMEDGNQRVQAIVIE